MKKKQKSLLKQAIDLLFKIDIIDIFEKKISPSKTCAQISLPSKYKGRKAKIVIYK